MLERNCSWFVALVGVLLTATFSYGQGAVQVAQADAEFGDWKYPGASQNSKSSFAGTLSDTVSSVL